MGRRRNKGENARSGGQGRCRRGARGLRQFTAVLAAGKRQCKGVLGGKGANGQEQAVYERLYGQGLRLAAVGTLKRLQQRWGTESNRNGV